MLAIIGAVAAALLLGTVVYLAVKLTISYLKKYKKKKNSKLLVARVKDLIKNGPTISLDDLDGMDEDDVILAEYDLDEDELVQDIAVSNDVDERTGDIINNNGGIVVFD